MVKIQTSRFGEIEIEEESIITMTGGLIGFPEQEKYIIVRHNPDSPFFWLQAAGDPELAFVIVDPLVFKPDYKMPYTPHVFKSLEAESADELGLFVIVTIPAGSPTDMTANLLGPVVVNMESKLARQLVLDENDYSHRYPIMKTENDAS